MDKRGLFLYIDTKLERVDPTSVSEKSIADFQKGQRRVNEP
jgi:hypothetical protein